MHKRYQWRCHRFPVCDIRRALDDLRQAENPAELKKSKDASRDVPDSSSVRQNGHVTSS